MPKIFGKNSTFKGKPGRSGTSPGSRMNALKNGTHLNRRRLVVGELPLKMISVQREARAYRMDLERAVLNAKGVIDDEDAHTIDAAAGCTLAIGVNRWLLRQRLAQMTVADIRACNQEMRFAKRDRARIVKELGLRRKPEPLTLTAYVANRSGGVDK